MYKISDRIRKRALFGIATLGIAALTTVGVVSVGKENSGEEPNPLVDLNTPEMTPTPTQGAPSPGEGDLSGTKVSEGDDLTGREPEEGDTGLAGTGEDLGAAQGFVPEQPDIQKPDVQLTDIQETDVQQSEQDAAQKVSEGDGRTGQEPAGKGTQTADAKESSGGTGGNTLEPSTNQESGQAAGKEGQVQETLNPQVLAESLNYQKESGLLWPIRGDILIPYSPEHGVYHSTLDQFRTSESLVLSSKVGTPVFAAAKGVVTSITEEVRTGTTVTLALGNRMYLIYGQLATDGLAVGDIVEAGECIGAVAEPTRYYVVEGPSLYFQVVEGEDAVDPMLFLREAQ